MSPLRILILLAAFLLMMSVQALAHHPNLQRYSLELDGPFRVLIEWEVDNPALVSSYYFERSTTTTGDNFQRASNITCQRSGTHTFRCTDEDLYKIKSDETVSEERAAYRLIVTHTDYSRHTYFEASIPYTTNAVRRTWGSIKAMFQ